MSNVTPEVTMSNVTPEVTMSNVTPEVTPLVHWANYASQPEVGYACGVHAHGPSWGRDLKPGVHQDHQGAGGPFDPSAGNVYYTFDEHTEVNCPGCVTPMVQHLAKTTKQNAELLGRLTGKLIAATMWAPLTKSLPELQKWVLVYGPTDVPEVVLLTKSVHEKLIWESQNRHSLIPFEVFTHWLPLPEPPPTK